MRFKSNNPGNTLIKNLKKSPIKKVVDFVSLSFYIKFALT